MEAVTGVMWLIVARIMRLIGGVRPPRGWCATKTYQYPMVEFQTPRSEDARMNTELDDCGWWVLSPDDALH